MKKKVLSIFAAVNLVLFGITLFSCAADGSDSSNDSESGGGEKSSNSQIYSPISNVRAAANTEKIVLAWQNPEKNYFGVKITMEPAEGNLTTPKTCQKESNTFTATGLKSGASYKFSFISLDSNSKDTDKITTISITTAVSEAPESPEKPENPGETPSSPENPPEDVSDFKVKVEDLVATLSWKKSSSENIFGYFISYEKKAIEIGTLNTARSVLTEAMPTNTVFVSPDFKEYSMDVKAGNSYTFTVKTVGVTGIESNGITSEEISISNVVGPAASSRTESLDYIFGTDSVADIKLTIKRSEWQTLLDNYDKNLKNEDCIHADFEMKKGGNTWKINDIGMRLRGNTSRVRPQVGENYYQAHFKLDFEEWCDDSGEERKLAGCMKGLNLKRFKEDPSYVREVFGYNFFRKNGIWTAPRAGYAHLFITIDEENGSKKTLDYGVYAMIEEINKQFLKERSEISPEIGTKFNGNKGNLWKCTWQSANGPSMARDYDIYRSFGVEEINLDENQSMRYDYDLKTNKDDFYSARDELIKFITDLNKLSINDEIKNFYESKMDVDLFLKTYACNVVLGMDDDYWNNKNNYYFYFDKKGKCYFIPYDYDNILGTNCSSDTATRNPLDWGELGYDAPLVEKLLSVPEYKEKYAKYLLELCDESSFVKGSQVEIARLHSLVQGFIKSKDLTYSDTSDAIIDDVAPWCTNSGKYKLLSGDETTNFFRAKAKTVKKFCNLDIYNVTFNLNGGKLFGSEEESIPRSVKGFEDILDVLDIGLIRKDGLFLAGWFDSEEGGNEVNFVASDITVYAHYVELPYKYWTDEGGIPHLEFTFNPDDFGLSPDSVDYVTAACVYTGWSAEEHRMNRGEDNLFRIEYSGAEISSMWPGFKFVVNGKQWLGPRDGYKYWKTLPEDYYFPDNNGNLNFLISELSGNLN